LFTGSDLPNYANPQGYVIFSFEKQHGTNIKSRGNLSFCHISVPE